MQKIYKNIRAAIYTKTLAHPKTLAPPKSLADGKNIGASKTANVFTEFIY
jgi:hypothetical protein